MHTFRPPRSACPFCRKEMDAASYAKTLGEPADPKPPRPGDVTICFYCCQALEYGPALELLPLDFEKLSAEDRKEVERLRFGLWRYLNFGAHEDTKA